jgi:hypothetical protein
MKGLDEAQRAPSGRGAQELPGPQTQNIS